MANRSNVMGLHGLKNKPSRNSFDLSYRNLFTAKVGELLPCFVQELNPGDSIKVNTSYFTRTAPLQSNAFTRLRENVQFFFVPYSSFPSGCLLSISSSVILEANSLSLVVFKKSK